MLGTVLCMKRILVAHPLGGIVADVQHQRTGPLGAIPVLAGDHVAVERRAVAAVVLQIEESDAGKVLTAGDQAEDVVVILRVDLAPQAEVEQVERIAGVDHQSEGLGEPELAVVVGVVEVDVGRHPHASLDARLRKEHVDAAVEAEADRCLKLWHVGARAVCIGPVRDVEALGNVRGVVRLTVELETVGVEPEGEARLHLEAHLEPDLEADDPCQRHRLVKLILQLRQLEREQRHVLPHHHLEGREGVLEHGHAEAATVGRALDALLLGRGIGTVGILLSQFREGVEGGVRCGIRLRAIDIDTQGDVVVAERAVGVFPRVLIRFFREPEPAERQLHVDARRERRDAGHQRVDGGHRVDDRPHALGLLTAELLDQVDDTDVCTRDVGEHRHLRRQKIEDGPNLLKVGIGLVDDRLHELRQEAAQIEANIREPDLRQEVHLFRKRRVGVDPLVGAGRRRLRCVVLLGEQSPQAITVVILGRRAGIDGILDLLLGNLDLRPRRLRAPVNVQVGEDLREGGAVAHGERQLEVGDRRRRDIDLEDAEAARPHLGEREPVLARVGIDVANRLPRADHRIEVLVDQGLDGVDDPRANLWVLEGEIGLRRIRALGQGVENPLRPFNDVILRLGLAPLRWNRESKPGLQQIELTFAGIPLLVAVLVFDGIAEGVGKLHRPIDDSRRRRRRERDQEVGAVVGDDDRQRILQRLVDEIHRQEQRLEGLVGHQRGATADGLDTCEDDRCRAQGDRAHPWIDRPPGGLVGASIVHEHEQRLALVPNVVGVGVERAAPAAGGDDVDAVLLRVDLILDQHAIANLQLHAVDDADAGKLDVRRRGDPHRQVERLVVGPRPLPQLELIKLPYRHRLGRAREPQEPILLEDRLALGVGQHEAVGQDGRIRNGLECGFVGAGVDDVDPDHAAEHRRQLIIAVDAGVVVVARLGVSLRPGAGVE